MTDEKSTQETVQEPQAVGADIFEEQQIVAQAPPGTVIILPGPKPVYLNKEGALAWLDRQIARSRAKVHDPNYVDEKQGAVERLAYLMAERDKLANARGQVPVRLASDFAHPAVNS